MEAPTERQSPVSENRKNPWEEFDYKPLPLIDVSGVKLLMRVVVLASAGFLIVIGQILLNYLHFEPFIHFTVLGIMYLSTGVLALLSILLLLMVSYRFTIRLLFESRMIHDSYVRFLLARKAGEVPRAASAAALPWLPPQRGGIATIDDDGELEGVRRRERGNKHRF